MKIIHLVITEFYGFEISEKVSDYGFFSYVKNIVAILMWRANYA
jgi:hypothetical protein